MTLVELVRLSIAEDVGPGDVTVQATVPAHATGGARIYAKQSLIVCGHAAAAEVFAQLGATYEPVMPEGARASPDEDIARVSGPLGALITGERVALNFLMRLSGIATHTASVVSQAHGLRVLDTRKTTPLHRALEKHAVRCGGAHNHRGALYDGVLIKDNHIVAAGGVSQAVGLARTAVHHLLRVECEVESLAELELALAAGADAILLDNMNDDLTVAALRICTTHPAPVWVEASGNMSADRIAALAARLRTEGLRLDAVSMGGLVHQARWADISMRVLAVGASA